MTPLPARVLGVRRETHDTFTLDVASENGPLPLFAPGQFSMLYVFGVGELPISISSDPGAPQKLSYTVRAVGRATEALVRCARRDVIGVRGPFGTPWPMDRARGKDLLIIAGGIGLAPLRPVLYSVLGDRTRFGAVTVLYGARSPRDLLYTAEKQRWARHPDVRVLTTVDYGGLKWKGHVGVVTTLFRRLQIDPARTLAMICGPEIMMRAVVAELTARGLGADDIFLSMERNMKCGLGTCGHCQLGPFFVCKDGPVFPYRRLGSWMNIHEV